MPIVFHSTGDRRQLGPLEFASVSIGAGGSSDGNGRKMRDRQAERKRRQQPITLRPRISRDYPLNLSILVSGGKETNQDSLSNGE